MTGDETAAIDRIKHSVPYSYPVSEGPTDFVMNLGPTIVAEMRVAHGGLNGAWARLTKAECAVVDCQRGEIHGAYQERDAARQALRDLGVDVDKLLEEK